jgi:hypothetical protein
VCEIVFPKCWYHFGEAIGRALWLPGLGVLVSVFPPRECPPIIVNYIVFTMYYTQYDFSSTRLPTRKNRSFVRRTHNDLWLPDRSRTTQKAMGNMTHYPARHGRYRTDHILIYCAFEKAVHVRSAPAWSFCSHSLGFEPTRPPLGNSTTTVSNSSRIGALMIG